METGQDKTKTANVTCNERGPVRLLRFNMFTPPHYMQTHTYIYMQIIT